MDDITLETATLSDLGDILEIEYLCFGEDSFSETQFVYLITHSKGAFFTLKSNHKAIAYISLLTREGSHKLRIYSIAVHPEERGKGLAQLLIDKTINYAKTHAQKAISLEVKVSNAPAINLYKKNGFVITGTKPNYYHDGSDAYLMQLSL